jgi:HlyD family secretion protein
MKKKLILLLLAIGVVVVIIIFGYFQRRSQTLNSKLSVSGNIEATETRLSFQVAGKIKELLADEGKFVRKGEVLATLYKEELAKIKEQERANLEAAKSNYDKFEKDYIRAENLLKDGAITEQQKDAAKNSFDVAKAKLEAAQHALELADIRLGYADLVSTVDGFVLTKSAEAGEVTQTGSTVFTVADLNDIWLTAYINETDLGRVKLNQQVDIKTDTYPDKTYKGRISFISQEAEFTAKYIQTKEERVKLVYRIKVDVDNTNLELKPGMPADGYIIE